MFIDKLFDESTVSFRDADCSNRVQSAVVATIRTLYDKENLIKTILQMK